MNKLHCYGVREKNCADLTYTWPDKAKKALERTDEDVVGNFEKFSREKPQYEELFGRLTSTLIALKDHVREKLYNVSHRPTGRWHAEWEQQNIATCALFKLLAQDSLKFWAPFCCLRRRPSQKRRRRRRKNTPGSIFHEFRVESFINADGKSLRRFLHLKSTKVF